MRIRTLVPALACLAAAPAFMLAADTAVGPVKLDGFVDTLWGVSDAKNSDSSVSGGGPESGFQYFAKLGAEIAISKDVGGRIDITNNNNAYTNSNTVYLRQAYGTWAVNPDVTFKSGRFIDCIGWMAPYAPGLLSVNTGPINSLYGVDSVVGADVTVASKDKSWKFEGTIANGFFGENVGESSQAAGSQNNAYAYIVDAAYKLPGDKGVLDAEAVYEQAAAASVGAGDGQGGNGYHLGVNATLTPMGDLWTIGLEAIYQHIKQGDNAPATEAAEKNVGLLAQANYKIPKAPWGATATGTLEYVKKTNIALVDGDTGKTFHAAVAILTNPAGTTNFGLNAELGFDKTKAEIGAADSDTHAVSLTLEALYVIP